MTKIIFIIIELIVLGISVIMIYDARKIQQKHLAQTRQTKQRKY